VREEGASLEKDPRTAAWCRNHGNAPGAIQASSFISVINCLAMRIHLSEQMFKVLSKFPGYHLALRGSIVELTVSIFRCPL